MNQKNIFRPSAELSDRFAALEARAERDALKTALKAHAYDIDLGEDFVPGVLNDEELAMIEADPELAKFLAMCTEKELRSMRRDREQARRERGIGRVQ
jgi:hypothetical protein